MPESNSVPSDPTQAVALAVLPTAQGPSQAVTFPIVPVASARRPAIDPGAQYVGTPHFEEMVAVPALDDALARDVGPEVYEAMRRSDGVIASSIRTSRAAAIGTRGPALSPRYPDPRGRPLDFRNPPDDLADDIREDVLNSAWALEYCQEITRRIATGPERLSWALSECFWLANKLAEIEWETVGDFDDKRRLMPRDIRPKHWSQWAFVLDRYNNWTDVLVQDAEAPNDYLLVPADKFLNAAFCPETDSPVGTTVGEPCFLWWKLKGQVPRRANQFMTLFSLPIPVVEMAENATSEYPIKDDGTPDTTKAPVPPHVRAKAVLAAVKAGSGAVTPYGSRVYTLQGGQSAEPFDSIADMADRQNVHTLTGTMRSSLPTDRNSKADAATAENVSDVIKALIGTAVALAWRQLYLVGLTMNRGRAFALAYLPAVAFGESEKKDIGKWADALSKLAQAGFITPSQRRAALRLLLGIDLPEPPEEELDPAGPATGQPTGSAVPPGENPPAG